MEAIAVVVTIVVAVVGLVFGAYQWRQRRRAENLAPEVEILGERTVRSRQGGESEPWIVSFKVRVTNKATRANTITFGIVDLLRSDGVALTGYALSPERRAGQGPWVAGNVRVPDNTFGTKVPVGERRAVEGHVFFLVRVGERNDLVTRPMSLIVEDLDGRGARVEVEPGRSAQLR